MPKLGEVYVAYKALGLDDMNRDISMTEKGVRSSAGAMAASIAGMGVAVAAIVTKFGTEFDKVESQIQAQLGNVEKNMLFVKDLFRTGLVDGIEEAGAQATAAIRAFGNETQAEIKSSLQFGAAISEQFKVDAPELFSATKTLIDNFKISSQEALDLVASGFEKGLDRSGDFLESINEYAVQFGSAGADAGQFFSLLETGLQGGVLGTDKAADAFKEFRVRIQDGSASTEEALAKIGLSVADVNKSLTTGGMTVTDVFQDVISRLRETDDSTVQMQAGVGLLGTMFEDLGTEAVLALDLAATGMDDVTGAAQRTLDSTQTAQRLFDQLVNEGILIAVEAWDKYEGRVKMALAGTLDFVKANRDWPLEMIDNMAGVWDILNVGFVSLMDVGGTTFIEIQHAGEIAWSAIQDIAGKAVSGMLGMLDGLAKGSAAAYGALGAPELEGQMTRAAMSIRMVARDVDKWSVNLDKATDSRKAALDAHNKIIDAMVDERAQYKAIGKDAKTSGDAVKKIFIEREKKNKEITTAIVRNESDKVKAVAVLTAKQQKEIEKANTKRIREAEKANRQIIKDREDMAREMEKLESGQFKEFEKQLVESQQLYEDFIRDQLGIKELSTESMAEIDREYQSIKEGVLSGEIESFDSAMTDMLTAKTLSMEKLMENDTAYSVFLAEQEKENKRIRMDFFETTGGFSTEYFAKLAQDIEAQAGVWKKAGVDAVAVEEWKLDQFRALDMQRLESSDNFFDGVRLGMLESQKDMTTWADAGKAIFGDFQTTLAGSFNQLFTGIIRGDMNSLSGAWDSLWSGMLDTVINNLSQMAAEWASQQIAGLAIQGASALSSAIFAKEGAFDVGRTGPGQPDPALGGAIPIFAHMGESILSADLTERIKSATGWEEFSAMIREEFGLSGAEVGGLWDRASDYAGAGANLFKAWQAFDQGDQIGGITEALNAMSNAFTTYGEQYGSQAATNIGGSLGSAAGAIGSGYGAIQSFEQGSYVQGSVQALQTAQHVAEAYNALTTTATAAEAGGAAAGGTGTAGGAVSSVGYVSGAGYGLAGNAVITGIMADTRRSGEENPALVGQAVSAIVGAAASSTGPIGSMLLGGIAGKLVQGAISMGGGYNTQTFTLTEVDPVANSGRVFSLESGLGFSGQGPGNNVIPDDPHPYSTVVNPYLEMLDADTVAINNAIKEIATGLGAAKGEAFMTDLANKDWQIRSSQRGYEESNYSYSQAADAVTGLAAIAWNDSVGNLLSAAQNVGAAPEIIDSLMAAKRDEILPTLSEARALFQENERARQEAEARGIYSYDPATGQAEYFSGGAATGGVVVPSGEDGILAVKEKEGILNIPEMNWIRSVGKTIKGQQPAGNGREQQLEKVVSLLTDVVAVLMRSESIQERIASRSSGELDFDRLADTLAPILENGAESQRFDFSTPETRRVNEIVLQGA